MIAAAHCETSCAEIRSGCQVRNVAFWPLADIVVAPPDVRFQGKSGHGVRNAKCPFLTLSGHASQPIVCPLTHTLSLW